MKDTTGTALKKRVFFLMKNDLFPIVALIRLYNTSLQPRARGTKQLQYNGAQQDIGHILLESCQKQ